MPFGKDLTLVMADRQGVEIDYCPQRRGVCLDRGALIIERSERELRQRNHQGRSRTRRVNPRRRIRLPAHSRVAGTAIATKARTDAMARTAKSFWKDLFD